MKTENAEGAPAGVESPVSHGVTELAVGGEVMDPLVLTLEDLRRMDMKEMKDVLMICGSGDPKGCIKSCKGVLIEDILNQAKILISEHNASNRLYIAAEAPDGYKVVFSWNEIYNAPLGDGILVIIEKNGLPLDEQEGQFALISAGDYLTGARYVKWLNNIQVVKT